MSRPQPRAGQLKEKEGKKRRRVRTLCKCICDRARFSIPQRACLRQPHASAVRACERACACVRFRRACGGLCVCACVLLTCFVRVRVYACMHACVSDRARMKVGIHVKSLMVARPRTCLRPHALRRRSPRPSHTAPQNRTSRSLAPCGRLPISNR